MKIGMIATFELREGGRGGKTNVRSKFFGQERRRYASCWLGLDLRLEASMHATLSSVQRVLAADMRGSDHYPTKGMVTLMLGTRRQMSEKANEANGTRLPKPFLQTGSNSKRRMRTVKVMNDLLLRLDHSV